MFISSILDHTIAPVPLKKVYKSRETNTCDIEVLYRQASTLLEEMKLAFPKSLKLKPASKFIRLVLNEKVAQNSELKRIEEAVIQKLLAHNDIQKRDEQNTQLNDFEKKHFKALLERIIGGCSSPKSHIPKIEAVECFVSSLFKIEKYRHLRLGTIISFLKDHCDGLLDIAKLSHNTLRKIMKKFAPAIASRKGRGNPNDLHLLKLFIGNTYGVSPQGI